IRSCSALTVGSSPYWSSPTGARAIAARMSSDGSVTVSERRSMRSISKLLSEAAILAPAHAAVERRRVAGSKARWLRDNTRARYVASLRLRRELLRDNPLRQPLVRIEQHRYAD